MPEDEDTHTACNGLLDSVMQVEEKEGEENSVQVLWPFPIPF